MVMLLSYNPLRLNNQLRIDDLFQISKMEYFTLCFWCWQKGYVFRVPYSGRGVVAWMNKKQSYIWHIVLYSGTAHFCNIFQHCSQIISCFLKYNYWNLDIKCINHGHLHHRMCIWYRSDIQLYLKGCQNRLNRKGRPQTNWFISCVTSDPLLNPTPIHLGSG